MCWNLFRELHGGGLALRRVVVFGVEMAGASTVHTVVVRDRRVSVPDGLLVVGCFGMDYLDLDLDSEWAGLDVVVALGDVAVRWSGVPVEVPPSVLGTVGWVPLVVYGSSSDGRRVVTQEAPYAFRVVKGGGSWLGSR